MIATTATRAVPAASSMRRVRRAPQRVFTVTQPTPRQDGQAGDFGSTDDGWYSYNLGSWHLISLNIECEFEPGGCNPSGSWFESETNWLARDLELDHGRCTLAYWHQPTFSSTATPFTSDSTEGATAESGGSCSTPTTRP